MAMGKKISLTRLRRKAKCKGNNNASEAKKWTNDETNVLIDMLEARSCLWDVFDKNYHARDKRDKAYQEIELELEVPASEIKAKINKLRSQLGREINKCTKTRSGQSTD